jgi:hypothetical protein
MAAVEEISSGWLCQSQRVRFTEDAADCCWCLPADHAVEEEVQRVRLKNIHLANALKKLEATIR